MAISTHASWLIFSDALCTIDCVSNVKLSVDASSCCSCFIDFSRSIFYASDSSFFFLLLVRRGTEVVGKMNSLVNSMLMSRFETCMQHCGSKNNISINPPSIHSSC